MKLNNEENKIMQLIKNDATSDKDKLYEDFSHQNFNLFAYKDLNQVQQNFNNFTDVNFIFGEAKNVKLNPQKPNLLNNTPNRASLKPVNHNQQFSLNSPNKPNINLSPNTKMVSNGLQVPANISSFNFKPAESAFQSLASVNIMDGQSQLIQSSIQKPVAPEFENVFLNNGNNANKSIDYGYKPQMKGTKVISENQNINNVLNKKANIRSPEKNNQWLYFTEDPQNQNNPPTSEIKQKEPKNDIETKIPLQIVFKDEDDKKLNNVIPIKNLKEVDLLNFNDNEKSILQEEKFPNEPEKSKVIVTLKDRTHIDNSVLEGFIFQEISKSILSIT